MRTILSLYIASLKEYTRDRLTLFWTLAFPILFIVLFGTIFGGGNSSPDYKLGLVNLDTGQYGSSIVEAFKGLEQAKVFEITNGSDINAENTYRDELKQGKLDLVVVIPADVSQNAVANQTTNVQMYYDPSKPTDAQIKQGIVNTVLSNINESFPGKAAVLKLDPQGVTSSTLTTIDFLVPGILAMSMMQLGLFGTTLPIVSLRERKILRRLGATPLPRSSLLLSQILLRLTIAAFQTGLIVGIGAAFYKVHVANPLGLVGIVALGASAFIGLGYMIASVSKTQDTALGITQAVNFPMLFLSGIFFPITALSSIGFLSPIIRALPVTYLADAMRQVMVNSIPDFPIWTDVGVLAAWVLGTALISARFFKWE